MRKLAPRHPMGPIRQLADRQLADVRGGDGTTKMAQDKWQVVK